MSEEAYYSITERPEAPSYTALSLPLTTVSPSFYLYSFFHIFPQHQRGWAGKWRGDREAEGRGEEGRQRGCRAGERRGDREGAGQGRGGETERVQGGGGGEGGEIVMGEKLYVQYRNVGHSQFRAVGCFSLSV